MRLYRKLTVGLQADERIFAARLPSSGDPARSRTRPRRKVLLDWTEVDKRSLASIEVLSELRLVDLTDDARLGMGVPSDEVGTSDQALARA